jgi:hypothetical protein
VDQRASFCDAPVYISLEMEQLYILTRSLAHPSSSSRARAAAFAAFLLRSEWRYDVTHDRIPASVLNSVFGIRLHGFASLRSNADVSKQRPMLRHTCGRKVRSFTQRLACVQR